MLLILLQLSFAKLKGGPRPILVHQGAGNMILNQVGTFTLNGNSISWLRTKDNSDVENQSMCKVFENTSRKDKNTSGDKFKTS